MTDAVSVYVIGAGKRRHKIGMSNNVTKRLALLQTGSHERLRVCHSVPLDGPQARRVEAFAHYQLSEKRTFGEWFAVSEGEARHAVEEAVRAVEEGRDIIAEDKAEEERCASVRAPMPHTEFIAFLARHRLTQTEFASWFGRGKGSIWRHTLPPENKHHRPVSNDLEAFCVAFDMMSDAERKRLILRLKEVQEEKASASGVRLKEKGGE